MKKHNDHGSTRRDDRRYREDAAARRVRERERGPGQEGQAKRGADMTVDEFESLTFEEAAAWLRAKDEEAGVEPMSVGEMRHVYEQSKRCKFDLAVYCVGRLRALLKRKKPEQ